MSNDTKLTVTSDRVKELLGSLGQFKQLRVLVGVPSGDSARTGEGEINNATLLFMNNYGSPANNIPARPVMEIGIRNAQDAIAQEFKQAAKAAISDTPSDVALHYERAGLIASNSIKKAINEQDGILPISQTTAVMRERKGFQGTKALVVTGQMRSSITYLIRDGGVE